MSVPPDTDEAREGMWTVRTLAECVLAAPQDHGINVGLARDLARAALAAEVRAEQLEAALQPLVEQFEADGLYDHSLDDVPEDDWQSGPNVTLRMVRAARAAVAGDPL